MLTPRRREASVRLRDNGRGSQERPPHVLPALPRLERAAAASCRRAGRRFCRALFRTWLDRAHPQFARAEDLGQRRERRCKEVFGDHSGAAIAVCKRVTRLTPRDRGAKSRPRARAGERIDQRIGLGLVRRVEIGVPFVEQIDPRIGRVDDLLKRFELPLAGREAKLLVDRSRRRRPLCPRRRPRRRREPRRR